MIRAVVTDIEGTTSSLTFVKDVMFPYSRARIGSFIRAHAGEPQVAAELTHAREIAGANLSDEELIAVLELWIDEDRKITPLKTLQGLIWEEGFNSGEFTAHVYDEVVRNFDKWRSEGRRLYVYSSGSVGAQKLFFAHTAFGDLRPFFSGHFDTNIGGKREAESYRRLVGEIGLTAAEIAFLSDIREELDAAREAGVKTYWVVREGPLDPVAAHPQVRDFDAIEF